MIIERIDLYHVAMPLVAPWRTLHGEETVVESVLVKLTSGREIGWGETSPLTAPTYSPEWAGGVFAVLRNWLTPRLVQREVASGARLQDLLRPIQGNFFAKADLDLAWWDLQARLQEKPLYQLLGGTQKAVPVGADFGVMDSLDELLSRIDDAVQSGYQRVKLKFRPGWDLPVVRAVRQTFPKLLLHIDCNGAYRLEDAPLFQQLDEFNLTMIEQPLAADDLLDHAALQMMLYTPVCLDESITSLDKARKALALGACRFINIKPGRVGGLTNAIAIHDLCRSQGIGCWVGGMLESAVGAAHCLALATLPGFNYPADIFPSNRFYGEDLGDPEVVLSGPSEIAPLEQPGIGTIPNAERLARMTLDHAVIVR
jgi:O-succinylbenzoate synthase